MLLTRLLHLEGQGAEGRSPALVLWLGLDGRPEIPLEDVDPERPLIVLPRKAPDAETWAQWARQRWPQYGGGPDATMV
jgi:hypothetical protein